ncbi:MAG: bifunctional adenosylcobinamide kinase/adenosylcobinamide-phosphate guanylyltransferase [Chloroflexi bacterium]|nr:bifunctional adenosylcobinamide kinase/adenosylcobinamide-phosphate guanylyltransferase [Chloroflexota bacterium]
MGRLLLVTGGARSGKSAFAEHLAGESRRPVYYLATMEPGDEELRDRVARHRARRPADWMTVEEPRAIAEAVADAPGDACVLLDCLSLWVTNRLLELDDEEPTLDALDALETALDGEVDRLIEAGRRRPGPTIVVTNEVGSGLVPPYPLGRAYRDVLGRANQRVSRAADGAWLLVAGRALELPSPAQPPGTGETLDA